MNEIPRRTWAPFVGAALAALTAGSLVVFSLVAQRTSLDGFPERRTAAPIETAEETPASITIDPVDGPGGNADAEPAPTSITPSLPLIEVADTIPAAASDVVALADTAADTARARPGTDDLDGRFRAEGILLANRSGGGDYEGRERGRGEAGGHDERHGGKHTHKSHDMRAKKNNGKNNGKSNGKSNCKHNARSEAPRGAARSSRSEEAQDRRGGPPPHAGPHASGNGRPSHGGGSDQGSGSAKPSSGGSPPAHSNAGGNGKSGGKGHKKH